LGDLDFLSLGLDVWVATWSGAGGRDLDTNSQMLLATGVRLSSLDVVLGSSGERFPG
jgi:hypothetical protein